MKQAFLVMTWLWVGTLSGAAWADMVIDDGLVHAIDYAVDEPVRVYDATGIYIMNGGSIHNCYIYENEADDGQSDEIYHAGGACTFNNNGVQGGMMITGGFISGPRVMTYPDGHYTPLATGSGNYDYP